MCKIREAERRLNEIDKLHDSGKISQEQHDKLSHEVLEKLSRRKSSFSKLKGTIFSGEF